MLKRIKLLSLAGMILLAFTLLAACQPQEPSSDNGVAVEEAASGEPPKTAPEAESGLPVLAESISADAKGVTVGFTADGHAFMGDPNAPVLIEEYSDFQCPFCQRFHDQTLDSLVDNQIAGGEAVLVFYDFPLTNIHPQAFAASRAVRCAGEQGAAAYWQMHDQMFEMFGQWNVSDPSAAFSQYATTIGLDTGDFDTCFASDKYTAEVQADLASGQQRGVTGTPAFFINDQLVAGAQPTTVFNQAIAQAAGGQAVAAAQPAQQPASDQPSAEIQMPTPVTFSENYANTWGDPNAPVTIIEFTDYQCPFCSRHSTETMPTIMAEMIDAGRVHYIMKDLPLDDLHPQARLAAVAARCAGEQEAYAEMHDLLFASQEAWAGQANVAELFTEYAATLSLNNDDFVQCLASGRYDAAIEENVQEAQSNGIGGTPSFFIEGYNLFRGAQPYEVFDEIVTYAENGELEDRIRDAVARQNAAQQAAQLPPTPVPDADVPTEGAHSIGDPDAPVTIVEYTDYQCPFCSRHFSDTLPQIIQNYVDTGVVRYVFKDFPLTSIHPQAVSAAEAARCAGEQDADAFVDMHFKLFETQQVWSGNGNADALFTGYATDMGLDETEFADCLASDKFHAQIQADLSEGSGFGVRGTPAFFINGAFVSGAQPYSIFDQAITAAQAAAVEAQ